MPGGSMASWPRAVRALPADWNASATLRTGTTPSGTHTERQDTNVSGTYHYWIGDWLGVNSGSQAFGITSWSGFDADHVGVEIDAGSSGQVAGSAGAP